MTSFTHLHNHTEGSLLDGMTSPEEAILQAKEHGQEYIAITDHGSMAQWIRFQEAANKHQVNPIFGVEAYFTENLAQDREDKNTKNRFHLIMLAKNDEGMRNLYRMSKKSWTTGFYMKNIIDWNDVTPEFGRGIIATSSCMGGVVAKYIRQDEESKALQVIERMQQAFEDFYIEVQPWNAPELNTTLLRIADAMDIPVVGTIDCHYPTHAHKEIEEVLLCIGTWPSLKTKEVDFIKENAQKAKKISGIANKLDFLIPDRNLNFMEHDLHIMSTEEVVSAFQGVGIMRTDIYDNTMEIAEKCSPRIKFGQSLLPKYDQKYNSKEFLEDLAWFKMEELGLNEQRYKDQLKYELEVITGLNFSDYFLIIWDLVNWAKRNNIYVGAGRGSAAGCLLAYVLGITDIDPLEFGLLFWRFINPERLDYPDIDLDFEDRRREDVKNYLKERWGLNNVAGISTFGGFKAKATVKDVSRVFGCSVAEQNAVTQHFDTIEEFKNSPDTMAFRSAWPEVAPIAEVLNNRVRQAGAHAAGMVVSNRPLDEVCPLETRNDPNSDERILVTAYDMDDCQKLGLIKIDILGLNNLSVVHDAVDAIRERTGRDVYKVSQTLDDPRVFEEFTKANTVGVFQTESSAYRHLLLKMGIDNFNDLAASNALVRPGALLTQTGTYIKRKRGEERISYLSPVLEPITSETYGTFIYQEQIMQTAVELAGFTFPESDQLRKIIGKKKDIKEFEVWRQKFISGASIHITPAQASKMFDDFEKFAGYAFNKSHAIAYSKLSYQTMWLKTYYPTEYMWALLKNEKDKQAIATYLMEALHLGVKLLPPHVNKSMEDFTLDGDEIRFGFGNIKALGPGAVKEIMAKRPFNSIEEMQGRCNKMRVKVGTIEALDKVGAFEGIHNSVYEHSRYYFEYLNYPIDLNKPTKFDSRLLPCSHFVEGEDQVGIVKAIVRSTKRTPTYFRVELEDMTGQFTVFADKTMEIKDGDFVLAFVGGKTLYYYIDMYTLEEAQDDPFVQFLNKDPLEDSEEIRSFEVGTIREPILGKALVHVVGMRTFMTKAGKKMGSLLVWDGEDYYDLVIFPVQYAQNAFRLKQWTTLLIKPERMKDGKLTLAKENSVLDVASFLAIKRMQKTQSER